MKMKKSPFVFVLLIFLCSFYFFRNKPQPVEVIESSSLASLGNYCLAVRGNGELEPAHWGAASRVIEQWGLPSAMAGGSSASITMFLLNAVAQNPFVNDSNVEPAERNRRAALLIKSFMGFFLELKNTKFSRDFFKLYGTFNKIRAQEMTNSMGAAAAVRNYSEVLTVLNRGTQEGVFSLFSTEPLLRALKNREDKKSQFYIQQLKESVELFGKFDANKDPNLFFRPGIVDFEKASSSFGRWASFYALPEREENTLRAWKDFVTECSSGSENKTWVGLVREKPQCASLYHKVFQTYFDHEPKGHFEEKEIGHPIAVYPSTAVLIGSAARQTEKAFQDYLEKLDPQFGNQFHIQNPEEVVFGYWGAPEKLREIKSLLDTSDEKSRRFYPLGKASWKKVLSLSPAEPGLSALLPFQAGKEKLISAGGWSDLHPINVLKASGCEKVVYLTRQGGESLFAQGVANRLMNLQRDVSLLNTTLNDSGDVNVLPNDGWSKLFNLANPKSSVNTAFSQATAIACTNWNAFDVKTNLAELVEDAYTSAYWINPKAGEVNLTPVLKEKKPGCQPF